MVGRVAVCAVLVERESGMAFDPRGLLVPTARLELAQLSPLPPQDSVSTNFTTSAALKIMSGWHEAWRTRQREILPAISIRNRAPQRGVRCLAATLCAGAAATWSGSRRRPM